ncbi:MAG: mycothiol transferase [Streptosporangiaceae bacterium]
MTGCSPSDAAGQIQRHGNAEVCVRWVYQRVIGEYARHNGHADLLRERIDGTTGL